MTFTPTKTHKTFKIISNKKVFLTSKVRDRTELPSLFMVIFARQFLEFVDVNEAS